ncbi:uncharacterized protein LOC106650868 [Trichogramma pretiosum]|uniref:uncharacterized protein LOC106650868 n=1 Tax=Trichogramma pretiosum TaxID=7493 RepID=UPI0006C94258|nr:uncharacterized protein LOC106650868 [Trichogramma pretiosum]
MAYSTDKGSNFKLKFAFSSGDSKFNESFIKHNKTRISVSNKISNKGDTVSENNSELDLDLAEVESAYEDSCYSEHCDEESVQSDDSQSSFSKETPSTKLTTSKTHILEKPQKLTDKFPSTSKLSDDELTVLDNKIKCLNFHETPSRNVKASSSRKNMSFTNDEVMKIERDNEILLKKIITQHKAPKTNIQQIKPRVSSSAINRRRLQKKIEEENMVLLKRLQRAKSCVLNSSRISGYRTTQM